MIIRQHLTTKTNDIPLTGIIYATEHRRQGDQVEHVGWKIIGQIVTDDPKKAKQRYEIIFTPDELQDMLNRGAQMQHRFDDAFVRGLQETPAEDGGEDDV